MRTEATKENIGLLSHKDKVRFALFCAKQIEQTVPEAIACIRVVERWLDGKATADECRRVAYAAYNAAAHANAAYAAYAATAHAANAVAAYAAYAAAANAAADAAANAAANAAAAAYTAAACTARHRQEIKERQEVYLYELIYINEIVEQTLLNG